MSNPNSYVIRVNAMARKDHEEILISSNYRKDKKKQQHAERYTERATVRERYKNFIDCLLWINTNHLVADPFV